MKLLRRLITLFRRNRIDDEIRREMEFHVAMEAAERERRGDTTHEARRLARADFGAAASVREEVRDVRGLTFWDHLVQDVRFGIRLLARQPGFSAIAIVILALGIGANTAVFSIVNVLLLKPRPWHADGEIVGVYHRDTSQPDQYRGFSYPDFDDMRARTDVFASVATHNFAIVGLDEVYDTISNDFLREGLTSKLGERSHHTMLVMARLRRTDPRSTGGFPKYGWIPEAFS